ncbi:hypothetical protein EU513_08075 [Yimella sp. RIT 621]|uniref:Putative glycosyltransferase n=1 Tax=Yimella lutea TaxID=587872 RepID=A0A542EC17_9MICO|nr:hypothetical protein EU513_08075 [Yimella sp. RIT 621]TQJ12826.1 putative glycosyltransferase [Yimella lutea]
MIGWYVHHHGSGHLQRLLTVAAHLTQPVTAFSCLPAPPGWQGDWVELAHDVGPDPDPDPTVRGALHWAPLTVEGYQERMGQIAAWIDAERPGAMVVDVSAEVTALSRLLGVPTATIVMPGVRSDRPHVMAYDLADLLIGLWPAGAHEVSPSIADRIVNVGGVSRFDGERSPDVEVQSGRVLVVCGGGGISLTDNDIQQAAAATGWDWVARGGDWPASEDLWRELAEADVVVTFAGQNAVAEVAAARKPAVVVATERPHDEQLATVGALRRLGIVPAVDDWPSSGEWPALLRQARTQGGDAWSRWSTGHGAQDFAAAVEALADRS